MAPKVFQVPGEPPAVHTQPIKPDALGVESQAISPVSQVPEAGVVELKYDLCPC